MSGYSDWEEEFNGAINIVVKTDENTLHEAADVLAKTIIDATPVGAPSLWKTPAPASYTPGNLKKNWETIHGNKSVTIQNETEYAYRVETGWSYRQAPQGMMAVSLLKWPEILDSVARKNKK